VLLQLFCLFGRNLTVRSRRRYASCLTTLTRYCMTRRVANVVRRICVVNAESGLRCLNISGIFGCMFFKMLKVSSFHVLYIICFQICFLFLISAIHMFHNVVYDAFFGLCKLSWKMSLLNCAKVQLNSYSSSNAIVSVLRIFLVYKEMELLHIYLPLVHNLSS